VNNNGIQNQSNDDYLFGKAKTLRIFALFALLMIFDFADRMVIAALLPAIKAEWHISDAQSGLLSSILFIGMILFAIPLSLLIDRWSRVKTAGLMGFFWSLASLAGAFTQNIGQLTITRAAVGAGESGYTPAAYAWITTALPIRRRQLALGIFTTSQTIGLAIGVALGGYIASHFGWRYALGLMAIPGFIIAALLYCQHDYPNPSSDPNLEQYQISTRDNLKKILATPSLLLAYFASAMGMLPWASVFYFLPTFLNRQYHITVQSASYLTSGILILTIGALPLGGWFMDRWNLNKPTTKLVYATSTAALATVISVIAFGLVHNYLLQYAMIVLAFFMVSSGGTSTLFITQELAPRGSKALSATCSVMTIHLLGSAPGPYLTGLISDHYDLTTALLSIILVSGCLYVLALLSLKHFYIRDLARICNTN